MRLSCAWLDELVGLGGRSPEQIAHALTFHTAAVEAIEERGSALAGVVTARVVGVRPHPGADRLRLCRVDRGPGETPEVVCGAPNVAEGQIVCFAREGLKLPNGQVLARRKIRGVESAGMICAEDELGLGEGHEGIIVLDRDTPVGVEVAEVLGARDTVLVVDNPSITHRPDLWGHVGFAREVGALLEEPFTPPRAPRADAAFAEAMGEPFPVEIEDPAACRRYVGGVLEGVTNGPSPWWLRCRLEALGMRSLGLLVDLSNLVMLEQGEPVHAFDVRDLTGGRIVVRRARPGETMRTLDGEERVLEPQDLVIADGERPVALAGVMGGENSEV
ncbi:MAG: YtpR family tRNA-binding protein, partial [Planctomycetota bacterium]